MIAPTLSGWGYQLCSALGHTLRCRLTGLRLRHVVEEVGNADGYHQALLQLPGNRRKLTSDGAIWRETLNRCHASISHPLFEALSADRAPCRYPFPCIPILIRRASYPLGPSSARVGRSSGWSQSHAFDQESPGLVRPIFRGPRPQSPRVGNHSLTCLRILQP